MNDPQPRKRKSSPPKKATDHSHRRSVASKARRDGLAAQRRSLALTFRHHALGPGSEHRRSLATDWSPARRTGARHDGLIRAWVRTAPGCYWKHLKAQQVWYHGQCWHEGHTRAICGHRDRGALTAFHAREIWKSRCHKSLRVRDQVCQVKRSSIHGTGTLFCASSSVFSDRLRRNTTLVCNCNTCTGRADRPCNSMEA